MTFESAVGVAQVLGGLVALLWLTLPVTVIAAIWRRRRYRPGSGHWLAWSVLGVWLLSIVWTVVSIVSGGWYGENGPSPQVADLEGAALLVGLAAIHVTLIRSSGIPKDED